MKVAYCDVSGQFWLGRNSIPYNPDRAAWNERWNDNWHVWCGCPL